MTLDNMGVILKGVWIDLCFNWIDARNFVHEKISLRKRCTHARHQAHNLWSPALFFLSAVFIYLIRYLQSSNIVFVQSVWFLHKGFRKSLFTQIFYRYAEKNLLLIYHFFSKIVQCMESWIVFVLGIFCGENLKYQKLKLKKSLKEWKTNWSKHQKRSLWM